MSLSSPPPTEEEIIDRSKPDYLYNHEFGQGRFFQVVHHDTEGFEIKLATKTMLKAVYIKEHDDIEGLDIIKVIDGKETQRIKLSKFNLNQLKSFLSFLSQINLKGLTERRLKLFDESELDEITIKTIKTLLAKKGGADVIEQLIKEGIITSKDIVNTGFRKRGLLIFEKLIREQEYWKTYASENGQSISSEEKVWQYFFNKNQWIFGYGLDYRFKGVLQKEFHASDTEADGSNGVISDFLLGDKRFTTFVEIKKPSTPLFGNSKNRSGSWCLSSELIDGVSQILEQKASGQIKFSMGKLHDDTGKLITQHAHDSKVVLIIGDWQRMAFDNDLQKEIKEKTFELFRRDSRNIEMITFDELFDRAKYIAER
jgi:hypothetical protein